MLDAGKQYQDWFILNNLLKFSKTTY
jgi:hypothetical protein